MPAKLKNPLSGAPPTAQTQDSDGNPVFTIKPIELTPARAIVADTAKGLIGAAMILWAFFDLLQKPVVDAYLIFGEVIATYLFYVGGEMIVDALTLQRSKIVLTTEAISVRRSFFWWDHYDRNLEHRFALLQHDATQAEYEQQDYEIRKAASKGKIQRKKRYYGDSFHVVLLYGGHREDLLDVYGPKGATAIVARLQYCDACLDKAVNIGGGVNQHPAEDWNDTPGDLRDA